MNLRFAHGGRLNFRFTTNQWDREPQQLDRLYLKLRSLEARNEAAERVLPIKKGVASAK
jgi:hypothetical protein